MTIAQKREVLANHYSRDWVNSKPDYQILAIYTNFVERMTKLPGIEQRKSNGKYCDDNQYHQMTIWEYLKEV